MWTKKTAWHSEHTRKCFSGSGFLPVWNPQLELQPLPHTNLPWIFRLGISKASRVLKGKQVYKVSLWERDLYQISWIVVFSLRASLRHFTPLAVIWFWISLKKKSISSQSNMQTNLQHMHNLCSAWHQGAKLSATRECLWFYLQEWYTVLVKCPTCTFRNRAQSINLFLLILHVVAFWRYWAF